MIGSDNKARALAGTIKNESRQLLAVRNQQGKFVIIYWKRMIAYCQCRLSYYVTATRYKDMLYGVAQKKNQLFSFCF